MRRVILYKSGIGYFEHLGRVSGNDPVSIDFTSAQLNDVLKSLTTIDLGGGRITGISEAPLTRRLGSLGLSLDGDATRTELFDALRGTRLEIQGPTSTAAGRLLSVERQKGWAVVDNTVGEDWTNVELSLVAGAPQSFIQHVSQPYYRERPVVPLPAGARLEPQTHAAAIMVGAKALGGALAGRVTDETGSGLPGVSVSVRESQASLPRARRLEEHRLAHDRRNPPDRIAGRHPVAD